VSTDEPPRRSWTLSALCIIAVVGVGYLGAVIFVLSLFWNGYSPISQVASDYGVGAYAFEMNSGFLLAGLGVMSLALALLLSDTTRGQKVGAVLLFPAGLALVANAFFTTDLEGAAQTLHGIVHGVGGAVFFFTSPVALLLVSRGYGGRWFLATLAALLVAVAGLALDGALMLNAGGLAERGIIFVVFSLLILTAAKIYKEA
jgi:hypothetical membrane protein